MFPDLSYILHYLFGTQPDNAFSIVKTFGLLLVAALLTGAYILFLELRRKEKEGVLKPVKETVIEGEPPKTWDIISNVLLGFFLGFKFLYISQNFPEFKLDPAAIVLSLKGNWIGGLLGGLLFGGLKYWEQKKAQLPKPKKTVVDVYPHERIGEVTIIAAIAGVIGAKIFAMVEDLDLVFSGQLSVSDFIAQFFSGSGLAIYGGLIVAFTACYIYLKRKNIPPIHVMDGVAPALMVAYGVGRLGCHFSGDGDWGIVNNMPRPEMLAFLPDWLWAYDYPNNVLQQGIPIEGCTFRYCNKLPEPVWPTSPYETIISFTLGGILWMLRKRIKILGLLFCIYLIFNGFERFWIEKIRVNERYDILGFTSTQAEFIAVCMMLLGVIGAIVLIVRHRQAQNA